MYLYDIISIYFIIPRNIIKSFARGRNWCGFNVKKVTLHVNVTRSEITDYYPDAESNQLSIFLLFLYIPVTLNKRLFITRPDNERSFAFDQRLHCVISYRVFKRQHVTSHLWIPEFIQARIFPSENIPKKEEPLFIAILLHLMPMIPIAKLQISWDSRHWIKFHSFICTFVW